MDLIRYFIKRNPRTIALVIVGGLISGGSSVALIALINSSLFGDGGWSTVIGFIGLSLVMALTNVSSQVLLANISQEAVAGLRVELSQCILDTPLEAIERRGSASLFTVLSSDISLIANALLLVPSLGINMAVIICCFGYLAWLSVYVFVPALLVIAVGVYLYIHFTKLARTHYQQARNEEETLFRHFRMLIDGVKELKLNATRRDKFSREYLGKSVDQHKQLNQIARSYSAFAQSVGQLSLFALLGVILFIVPAMVDSDPSTISGYVLVLLYLMAPFSSLLAALPIMTQVGVAWKKVNIVRDSLRQRSEDKGLGDRANICSDWRTIRLDDVTFRYGDDGDETGFSVGPLNLSINRNEVLFIVGGNGSGKTTIAKVLTGLYKPQSGRFVVDGEPVDSVSQQWYRQQFSAIFADYNLFEFVCPGNGLSLADSVDAIDDYLKLLKLDHKVKVTNGIFSTRNLSHGQRRRLKLLSAYVEDRPVYLFDEWAADQDPLFKEVFYTRLLPGLKNRGKAAVVITHDDRYFVLADRVVTMDSGIIIDQADQRHADGSPGKIHGDTIPAHKQNPF